MNTGIIQAFDFIEVERFEDLIFHEKLLCVVGTRQVLPASSSQSQQQDWGHFRVIGREENDKAINVAPSTRYRKSAVDCSSRESLRRKIQEVAFCLAPMEVTVLEGILEHGNESQIVLAQQRLDQSFLPTVLVVHSARRVSETSTSTNMGSSIRRASLSLRLQNNSTHNAMLRAFAKQRWKTTGNLIMNLNKKIGLHRVQRLLREGDSSIEDIPEVEEMKRCNRRTSTPAEMKEIALLAIQAAKEDGWSEDAEKENDTTTSSTLPEDVEPASRSSKKYKTSKFNPWERVDEDFTGIHFDFSIIGTSPDDKAALPHVLSPPLMHRLQDSLPFTKRGESFWLKYSLVRDGASMSTFLNKTRGSKYSLLAVETIEGEVFGAFVAEAWHLNSSFYGTGESFVWRMKHNRGEISDSIAEQAKIESEIEVFRYSHENKMIQLCHGHPSCRLAVGGGCCPYSKEIRPGTIVQPHQWGFAISFDDDCLLEGTTSPCITFSSPSLSQRHSDGSKFEVLNLEVWALTPCLNVEDAEIMECHATFLHRDVSSTR